LGRVVCDFDGITKHEAVSLRRKGYILYFIAWAKFNGKCIFRRNANAIRGTRSFAILDLSLQRQDIYTEALLCLKLIFQGPLTVEPLSSRLERKPG
jgi:hypothetical protein